ncbi:putative bifunctional diguanylate cyclase/phosphodiesterase [Shewanella polaris]|uniref:EAL domain-containing protein n=1 Tax=Shewanella polaris TaxID=2588449 RepID=A0A4Y5YKC1_9GAMM|nr:EAL domain-containing protein [Shewanella polaris]QDE33221.1 EAL domain-containing protein [Shewanella polaris]
MLVFSLRSVNEICIKDNTSGWRILRALIIFFVLGYMGIFYYLCKQSDFIISDVIFCIIMLFGGAFVVLVTRLSLLSLLKVEKLIINERTIALHDSLTGLPNRQYLMNSLSHHVKIGFPFSLLMIDLNRFKQVNDALGHYYGDLLLIEVGNNVAEQLPHDAQLFRLGGDEFAVIVTQSELPKVEETINAIHHALESAFCIESYDLLVGASVGVSHYPSQASEIGQLLQQADIAMYASKKMATEYTLYDNTLESNAVEKVNISASLKRAIENQEFELWYQPIINLSDNNLYGVEALIRWPRTDGSYTAPNLFIHIAEQTTLINQITDWVMLQVSKDMEYFDSLSVSLCIHINLSAKDLQDPKLIEKTSALLKNNLSSQQVMFEITESAMMTNIEQVKTTMAVITAAGGTFSIDDFGTGFSSLELLRDLPVKQIKIDRSFISNIHHKDADLAIVKSVIFLSQHLECVVVAEGVEQLETVNILKSLGCDLAQGYYYAKPMPTKDFRNFIKNKGHIPHDKALQINELIR